MAQITDIILITGNEDRWRTFPGNLNDHIKKEYELLKKTSSDIKECAEYVEKERGTKVDGGLVRVDSFAGGVGFMQCEVYIASLRCLDLLGFLKCFYSARWDEPDFLQLLIREEDDEQFTSYSYYDQNRVVVLEAFRERNTRNEK